MRLPCPPASPCAHTEPARLHAGGGVQPRPKPSSGGGAARPSWSLRGGLLCSLQTWVELLPVQLVGCRVVGTGSGAHGTPRPGRRSRSVRRWPPGPARLPALRPPPRPQPWGLGQVRPSPSCLGAPCAWVAGASGFPEDEELMRGAQLGARHHAVTPDLRCRRRTASRSRCPEPPARGSQSLWCGDPG